MLGGVMTNQDEEEVEDELAALQAEMADTRPVSLPLAPKTIPQSEVLEEPQPEPDKVRQPERQAILA